MSRSTFFSILVLIVCFAIVSSCPLVASSALRDPTMTPGNALEDPRLCFPDNIHWGILANKRYLFGVGEPGYDGDRGMVYV